MRWLMAAWSSAVRLSSASRAAVKAAETGVGTTGVVSRALCLAAVASVGHPGHRAPGWIRTCTANRASASSACSRGDSVLSCMSVIGEVLS